jgi:RimJ/RimL family protein N-acetyltransferase
MKVCKKTKSTTLESLKITTIRYLEIEAGVMPHNITSMRVLEKAGFHKEGIAQSKIQLTETIAALTAFSAVFFWS